MTIERAFTRIEEGQVHYRRTMEKTDGRPLVTLHMSPVASSFLVTLLETLDDGSRRLIAPDTLGNGDSAPLFKKQAEIPDFAEGLGRVLDSCGYRRDRSLRGAHRIDDRDGTGVANSPIGSSA